MQNIHIKQTYLKKPETFTNEYKVNGKRILKTFTCISPYSKLIAEAN